MNTDQRQERDGFTGRHADVTERVTGTFYDVYNELGSGLYLGATTLEVALLLNFGPKPQIKRFLLDKDQKKIRLHPFSSVFVLA